MTGGAWWWAVARALGLVRGMARRLDAEGYGTLHGSRFEINARGREAAKESAPKKAARPTLEALKARAAELGRPLTAVEGMAMLDPFAGALTPEEQAPAARQIGGLR